MKWMSVSVNEKPDTALRALDFCNDTFPTILLILQISAKLPISTALAEKVFSKTGRTLTALRCSIGEESLILLQAHGTDTPSKEVVTSFVSTHARRLHLMLLVFFVS